LENPVVERRLSGLLMPGMLVRMAGNRGRRNNVEDHHPIQVHPGKGENYGF
jgi:hypothetical protein